jgi:hypothetical protein
VYNELEQEDILSCVRVRLATIAYSDILLCSIWAIHKIRQTPDDLTDTIFAGHHQPLKVWILCLYFMGLNLSHSIGFSGGQLSSYVEGSSALDFPLIHDAQSQDPS